MEWHQQNIKQAGAKLCQAQKQLGQADAKEKNNSGKIYN